MNVFDILIEGGQTWTHRMRMLRQVIKTTVMLSLITSLIIFGSLMLDIPVIIYQGVWYHLKAHIVSLLLPKIEVEPKFWETVSHQRHSSQTVEVSTGQVIAQTKPHLNYLLATLFKSLWITGYASSITLLITLSFFLVRGRLAKRRRHLSGRRKSSPWLVAIRLKVRLQASRFKIGSLPLVKGTETQHILVTGGTGSGKTNCFHHLLPQIRASQQNAVIVDTTGTFISRYFNPEKDILLNPFDPVSRPWHPWAECRNKCDVEDLSECFIPTSHSENENYWRCAARALFSSLMQKGELTKNTSELTRWLLFENLQNLCHYVQGTKGAAHLDIHSEKTAASIRSVSSSFLSCLEFLSDTTTSFSIRDWVQNGPKDSWLFLSCTPAQRASIRPLISCWLSIATRSLIQLSPDPSRRLWLVVDELPSLNRLKDLEVFLAESRKYGGCALLALQSLSQLESIYGREATKTIIGNCATKIAFSEQDPEIAERISKAFGEHEIKDYQEGISYGAHEARDGVNLSTSRKILPLVSVTDLQSLKRNQAFVKLPENFPITKIKLKYLTVK